MKIKNFALITTIILFGANIADIRAEEPNIVISYIPLIGQQGYAEGKVVWSELTPDNTGQYAVIAMLHAIWDGGGGYYVKPYANNYLNPVDADGKFSILITTGGIDTDVDEVIFYFVDRKNISDTDVASPATMTGKYLTSTTVFRSSWVNPPQSPTSNIRPGFVVAGTEIKLSSQEGSAIRYTLDGSDPVKSSTAQTYNNNVFKAPENGMLLVKAVAKISDLYSPVSSFLWLPKEPLNTSFWGLNVSLALNGEDFGDQLPEATTRERMLPVAGLTKWVRTFGTINNGNEYINKIAKELGLHTMIGVYITDDAANNNIQIEGLRQILKTGPSPDLISIGNETSLAGTNPTILASCIDAVREMLLGQGLTIPVGSVDIAGFPWDQSVLEKLDFIGINIYSGIWDNTPESQIINALKQIYENTLSTFPTKLILLTEAGSPYNGGTYYVPNGTQTASEEKAANYLCGFLDWIQQSDIPSFYFEAYDEPAKSMNGGHPIEQYFGIMDGNMQIHPFYKNCIGQEDNTGTENFLNIDLKLYPNPFVDVLHLTGAAGCTLKIFMGNDVQIRTQKIENSNETIKLGYLSAGVYFFRLEKDGKAKTLKAIKK